jgi:hypothetical protein
MKNLVLASLLLCAAPALADRSARPAFKGVELYSWQESGNWNYVLLPGTNRTKSWADLQKATRLAGEGELRTSLAQLAVGEQVFWFNQLEDAPKARLQYPSPPTLQSLKHFCSANQVELHVLKR